VSSLGPRRKSLRRRLRTACNVAGRTQLPTGDRMPCDEEGYPGLGGCGWYLEIRHDDPQAGEVVTRYCHLLEEPPVEVGQAVAAAEPIGLVGNSGNSSGPHLHLEVHLGPSRNGDLRLAISRHNAQHPRRP
jgi:murein DD-endopeptidase MepM/ murein hydrolase activator NlpD